MKKIICSSIMLLSFSAMATMSHKSGMEGIPDSARLSKAHACFQELAVLGCGHPREDLRHFKSCLENVSGSLSAPCQEFSGRLYGKRAE